MRFIRGVVIFCVLVLISLVALFYVQKSIKDETLDVVVSELYEGVMTEVFGDEEFEEIPEELLNSEYVVLFVSSDGTVLKTDVVRYGHAAVPPDNPPMLYGEVFDSWDRDFSYVTENMTVKAVTTPVNEIVNVIALGSGYCKRGEEVTIPLQLCGDVCLCGLAVTVCYDPNELQFVEFSYEDDAVVANCIPEKGMIKLNYISMNNTESDVDLCEIKFLAVGDDKETLVAAVVDMINAFDENDEIYHPESETVEAIVRVVDEKVKE